MKVWTRTALLIFGLVVHGCMATKPIVRDRSLGVEEVLQRVRNHDQKIKTLMGDGSITVEGPDASGSGSFRAVVRKPDSLRAEFNGPFGIHFGTLQLSREQFVFYNWRENTATVGSPNGSILQSMFNLKLRYDEIVSVFTGEFLPAVLTDTLEKFTVDEGLYLLRYRGAGGVHEYRIDADVFVVKSYRLLDSSGKPSLIALASRFDDVDDLTMPKLLRVILPKERRSVTVSYGDLRLNEEVDCSFLPPKRAQVIRP